MDELLTYKLCKITLFGCEIFQLDLVKLKIIN